MGAPVSVEQLAFTVTVRLPYVSCPIWSCQAMGDVPHGSLGSFRIKVASQGSCFMDVSENRGIYPQIIHFNRVFQYKPSILGYHYFWKHPYGKSCTCLFVNNIKDLFVWKTFDTKWAETASMSFAYGKVTRLLGVGIFQPCKCSKKRIHLPRWRRRRSLWWDLEDMDPHSLYRKQRLGLKQKNTASFQAESHGCHTIKEVSSFTSLTFNDPSVNLPSSKTTNQLKRVNI